MKNKKQLNHLIDQAVKTCFKDGKVLPTKVEAIIKSLKKLPLSSQISALKIFSKKIQIEINKNTLEIFSSSILSKTDQDQILKVFTKKYNLNEVKNTVDPNLIAGIKVRIFDSIIDLSMAGRIKQLGDAING